MSSPCCCSRCHTTFAHRPGTLSFLKEVYTVCNIQEIPCYQYYCSSGCLGEPITFVSRVNPKLIYKFQKDGTAVYDAKYAMERTLEASEAFMHKDRHNRKAVQTMLSQKGAKCFDELSERSKRMFMNRFWGKDDPTLESRSFASTDITS